MTSQRKNSTKKSIRRLIDTGLIEPSEQGSVVSEPTSDAAHGQAPSELETIATHATEMPQESTQSDNPDPDNPNMGETGHEKTDHKVTDQKRTNNANPEKVGTADLSTALPYSRGVLTTEVGSAPTEPPDTLSVNTPRLLFTSAETGAGVTTFFLGLLAALNKRNIAFSVAQIGSSFVQAAQYRRISGRYTHMIDLWSLTKQQTDLSVARLSVGNELVLFSGDKGLYDILLDSNNAWAKDEAGVAEALSVPVILVLDAYRYGETIAAIVKGLVEYNHNISIHGVILNRIRNKKHYAALQRAIQQIGGPKLLGGVPAIDRSLIDMTEYRNGNSNPSLIPRTKLINCGELIEKHVDIEGILEISRQSTPFSVPAKSLYSRSNVCKIAVADDVAFDLTVQDNLDLIRRNGVRLIPFSPIADFRLPTDVKAVYIPSGYVQLYAQDLEQNEAMKQELRTFAANGGVIYAEGAAVTYLCKRAIMESGTIGNMVGIIPAVAHAVSEDTAFEDATVCELTCIADCAISPKGQTLRGYRDPRWIIRPDDGLRTAFELLEIDIKKPEASRASNAFEEDGFMPVPNILATTVHIHWASNEVVCEHFVKFITGQLWRPGLSN